MGLRRDARGAACLVDAQGGDLNPGVCRGGGLEPREERCVQS